MLPPTERALAALAAPYPHILSTTRRQADKYSQSEGERFTASIRLAKESPIGEPDAILERGAAAPAEFRQPADVEQFARGAVRPRGVEADLAGIPDRRRDHAGEFGDRNVLASADIDQLAI